VASIKPSAPGTIRKPEKGGPGTSQPGQIEFTSTSLKSLISRAYAPLPYQLEAPPWVDDERFDIVAKIPAGTRRDDLPLMLQSLLEERFLIQVGHRSRDMKAYALTVGKTGSKMQEYPITLPEDFISKARISGLDKDGVPIIAPGYTTAMMGPWPGFPGRTAIAVARQPISALCSALSAILEEPVVDQTGLAGRYDIRLHFATEPDGSAELPASSQRSQDPPEAQVPVGAPPLPAAIREQLGLNLERKKVPVDFLVVKHIERTPSEN
jgi:uncharacterized protein (TIGR03435 family)